MSATPSVSVIIPAYNGAAFLEETLSSVLAQTMTDLEVLVTDDGSRDASREIVERFVKNDPRFHLYEQTNAGTQAARNTCLQHASGEWIALLDQDDVWLPRKLELQLKLAEEDPRTNLLFTNYWTWDGQRDLKRRYRKRRKFPEGDVRRRLAYHCLFGASSVMIRRSTVLDLGGFDPRHHLAGDWDLWLRLAERGIWARGIWEPQFRYRIWGGNESLNTRGTWEEIVNVLQNALRRKDNHTIARNCQSALNIARGNLLLLNHHKDIPHHPHEVSQAVFQAWRYKPSRLKLLLMYAGLLIPSWLAGHLFQNMVYRRYRRKWSPQA